MAHFGVLSYKGTGHLNPLIALSRQLVARGHRVTFFLNAELEHRVRDQGFEFFAVGGSAAEYKKQRSNFVRRRSSSPIATIRHGVHRIVVDMEEFLQTLPAAIQTAQVNSLLIGEIALSGPTVAEMLRLPYFIVSTSLPHNFGWSAPRSITVQGSLLELLQRAFLEVSVLRMRGPVRRRLDVYRKRLGLGSIRDIHKTFPELAHITQIPRCFDLVRPALPDNFFYTGPFVDGRSRESVEFPWERLNGRPLVYASMGTTRNDDPTIFHRIAEACSGLNVQLVFSLGGHRGQEASANMPGNPLVVGNAPQLELLKLAAVVITHAGANTVLEALMEGRPMLALPMGLDQPAIAARLLNLGCAEVLPTQRRSAQQIQSALRKVLGDPSYRDAAGRLQGEIRSVRGLESAADIIEEALARYTREHGRCNA